jgi:all-beta uncharacterized protein
MTRSSRLARNGFVAAVALLVTCAPRPALGQPVVDPTKAEFSPSIDHGTTLADGTPVLDHYELELYLSGGTQPFQKLSLGKPAPELDGTIRVGLTGLPIAWPVAGATYVAAIAAVGAGGIARSGFTNTFVFSTACSFAVSPASQNVSAAGGTHSVTVTAGAGCGWTAASNAAWITVIAGSSGTGNGTVSYSVAANTSATARTGTLTVTGRTVTVTQAGACSVTVSPTSQTATAKGGPYSVTVTTGTGCGWSATSNDAWITVAVGSTGTGSGGVTYTVADNRSSTTFRTGTLTVAGQTVTVMQKAPSAPRPPRSLIIVK